MGKYVDAAFVTERLSLNNRWVALGAGQDDAIAACEATIEDLEQQYAGDRVDENDAFPRNYSGREDMRRGFRHVDQLESVKRAVVAQIEASLAVAELGRASWNVDQPVRVYPQMFAEIAPIAYGILSKYMFRYE
jgi:hypothetical protein